MYIFVVRILYITLFYYNCISLSIAHLRVHAACSARGLIFTFSTSPKKRWSFKRGAEVASKVVFYICGTCQRPVLQFQPTHRTCVAIKQSELIITSNAASIASPLFEVSSHSQRQFRKPPPRPINLRKHSFLTVTERPCCSSNAE